MTSLQGGEVDWPSKSNTYCFSYNGIFEGDLGQLKAFHISLIILITITYMSNNSSVKT